MTLLTAKSKFGRGLSLLRPPRDEALVHAVVLALQVKDLEDVLTCCHDPPVVGKRKAVLHPVVNYKTLMSLY